MIPHDMTFFAWTHGIVRCCIYLALSIGLMWGAFIPDLVYYLAEQSDIGANEASYFGVKIIMMFISFLLFGRAFRL